MTREPLTPEERALAERLARLGAPATPPAALDARILAAAHAAVARRGSRRPRWPLALGVAATLALAVGIAWQLRPAQDTAATYSEAPAAAPAARRGSGPSAAEELPEAAAADSGGRMVAAERAPEPGAPIAPAVTPATAPPEPPAAQAATKIAQAPQVSRQVATDPAAPARGRIAGEESVDRQRATRSAPPPAPRESQAAESAQVVFDVPAPPAPAPESAAERATGAAPVHAQQAPAEAARPAPGSATEAMDEVEVTGARIERDNAGFTDQALDDQPPATADSPEVQRAWLQRIRELLANGDLEGARASVAEFKRRYPRYALPDDLRELAPSAAP